MAPKSFVPDESLLSEILQQGIVSTVAEIEEEIGETLPATLWVMTGSLKGPSVRLPSPSDPSKLVSQGEIRLSCRRTYSDKRVNFFAESIYGELERADGFSGFEVNGTVETGEEHKSVRRKGITLRYGVWDWQGWV